MCGGARSPVPGILTARTLYARHCPSQPVHQQPVAGRLYLEGLIPSLAAMQLYKVVSSAYTASCVSGGRRSSASFVYRRKRVGPNMLPWGLPDLIVWVEEDRPPTTTRIFRSWR